MSCRGRGTLTVRRSDNPFFQTTTVDIGQDVSKEGEYAARAVAQWLAHAHTDPKAQALAHLGAGDAREQVRRLVHPKLQERPDLRGEDALELL